MAVKNKRLKSASGSPSGEGMRSMIASRISGTPDPFWQSNAIFLLYHNRLNLQSDHLFLLDLRRVINLVEDRDDF